MKRLLVLATVATMTVLAGCSGDAGSSSGGGSGSTGGGSGSTGGGSGSTGGGSGSTGGGTGSTGGGSGSTGGGSGSTGGGSGSTGGGSGTTGGGSGSTGGGSGSTGGGTGGSSGGGMGGGSAATFDAGWLDSRFGDAGRVVNDFGCANGAAVDALSALVYAGDAGLFAAGSGCTDTALAIMHIDENTGAPKSDIWDGGIFFLTQSQGTTKVVSATKMGNGVIFTGVLDQGMGGPKAVGLLKISLATGFIDTSYNAMSNITAGGATARSSFAAGNSMVVVGDAVLDDGGSSGFVARFDPTGALDTSFGDAGVLLEYGANITSGGAALANGLVVAGTNGTLTGTAGTLHRFSDAGLPDITFGTNGGYQSLPVGADVFFAVAAQPDGKFIVGGYTIPNLAQPTKAKSLIARLNSNGTLDATFGTSGRVELDLVSGLEVASQVTVEASGKVVAVVSTEVSTGVGNTYLVRLNANGSLDTTFGNGGGLTVPAVSVKLASDPVFPVMASVPGGYCLGSTTSGDDFQVSRFHE